MLPTAQYLLGAYGWVFAVIVLSMAAMMTLPLALGMSGAARNAEKQDRPSQSIREALSEADGHRGFLLLTIGFYAAYFQSSSSAVTCRRISTMPAAPRLWAQSPSCFSR